MSRLLFTVCPTVRGWQLFEGEEGRQCFDRHEEALATANTMAERVHLRQGIPTSVVMDMAGNEAVEISRHG